MKKYCLDLIVTEQVRPHKNYVLLKLTHAQPLPDMMPGQFAELRVDHSPSTFLRRPISINNVDRTKNEVWFLIQLVGDGTRQLAEAKPGDVINTVLPLGNGFSMPDNDNERLLLTGGGVGIAPMLFLSKALSEKGIRPTVLIGARSASDLMQLDLLSQYGDVYVTTEDGSQGEKGYLTQHSLLTQQTFDHIYSCGPKPMMMAVARYAKAEQIDCEVSLENKMACGLGACLCCVEKNHEGHHVCVCTEGPVFNVKELSWQI